MTDLDTIGGRIVTLRDWIARSLGEARDFIAADHPLDAQRLARESSTMLGLYRDLRDQRDALEEEGDDE